MTDIPEDIMQVAREAYHGCRLNGSSSTIRLVSREISFERSEEREKSYLEGVIEGWWS